MDKELKEIENFPEEIHRKLVNNYAISSAGALVAFDSVTEKDWIISALDIKSEEYDKAIELAKSTMTEDEIELYSNSNIIPGCFAKQYENEEGEFPTGFFYDEEDDLRKWVEKEFGDENG